MAALEFHNHQYGWVPAERFGADDREAHREFPRDGTIHLYALLPNGQRVARRHVAHVSHPQALNILNGRCRLCGLTEDAHAQATGRVYRETEERPGAPRETEPAAPLPDPKTPAQARAQKPRTTHA